MVKDTKNYEQGKASSSRQKRQRSPSITEDKTETVEEEERITGMLFDLDLIVCPICCDGLTSQIFQCENGHAACPSCCDKLKNKCPSCTLPIGTNRCIAMERLMEAIIFPCQNAKRGCTEKFSCGQFPSHLKECLFGLCYCPSPDCNYSGVYKDLYDHYSANHKDSGNLFTCGNSTDVSLLIKDKMIVLQESPDGPLVAVQCLVESQGVCVAVSCIAPSAPGIGEYSYRLSYSMGGKTLSFGSSEMNKIWKVRFATPDEDLMLFFPYDCLGPCPMCTTLKMKIHIRRLEEGVDEADEEEED